jgi:stress-induced-phosphoprotein 1
MFGKNKEKDKQKAIDLKNQGNTAYSNKKYKEAIDLYSKAIKLDDTDPTFYSNRCAAYTNLNQFGDALKDADKCIKLNPQWSKGHYRKGCVYEGMKKYEEAVASLREALKYDNASQDIQAKLSEVLEKIPKPKTPAPAPAAAKAKAAHAPVANSTPAPSIKTHNPDGTPLSPSQLKKEEGNFHYKESRYDTAIEFYTKAIELTKDDNEKATLYSNRAAAYQQLQSYTEVIIDCGEALALQPNNVKALIRRGLAYEAKEKWEQAKKDMQLALSIDPQARQASVGLIRIERCIRQSAIYK